MAQVQSLVRELRSGKPCGASKKKERNIVSEKNRPQLKFLFRQVGGVLGEYKEGTLQTERSSKLDKTGNG